MPNTTDEFALPYPLATDAPNGPAQIQALATAVGAKLTTVQGRTSNKARQVLHGNEPAGVQLLAQSPYSQTVMSQQIITSGPCVLRLAFSAQCYNVAATNVAGYLKAFFGASDVEDVRIHWHGHAGFISPSGEVEVYLATAQTITVSVHATIDPASVNGYTPFDIWWRLSEYPAA